ncbi:MAG TPA: hypothetical protein VEK10_11050, partial [Steroidobacteraceae bacterium]|nr:hypothetical protein [Steroidobacteraceae bacterium]
MKQSLLHNESGSVRNNSNYMIRCEPSACSPAARSPSLRDDALPQRRGHGTFQKNNNPNANAYPSRLHRAPCNAQCLQRDRHQRVAAKRHRQSRWRKRFGRASVRRFYDADSADDTATNNNTVATADVTTAD